jgi:hypothetical protein
MISSGAPNFSRKGHTVPHTVPHWAQEEQARRNSVTVEDMVVVIATGRNLGKR